MLKLPLAYFLLPVYSLKSAKANFLALLCILLNFTSCLKGRLFFFFFFYTKEECFYFNAEFRGDLAHLDLEPNGPRDIQLFSFGPTRC